MVAGLAAAQSDTNPEPRQIVPLIGAGWEFTGAGDKDMLPEIDSANYRVAMWDAVSVPHTFNSRLLYDDIEHGWYRRDITVPEGFAGKRVYVVFEGVTSIADVYVNGHRLGQHRGAFTRFLFDATDALHPGPGNHLAVRVDDRVSQIMDLLPNRTRLFKLWGGINRNVWLLATAPEGIDPTDFASPGVYILPSKVSEKSAKLSVKVLLRNTLSTPEELTARAVLLDPAGKTIATYTARPVSVAGKRVEVEMNEVVDHPLLWAPLKPEVYHVRVEVLAGGKVVDAVTQPTGFRTVVFDWDKGISVVNGKQVKLFGVDQHAELEEKANAVSDADLVTGFDAFADLGVTFVRLPHYPHAELEYDLCDTRGILCWPEDGHTNDEVWGPAAEQIVTEMVKQNYNHPSLALWSVGNEAKPDKGQLESANMAAPLVRKLDPSRPVVAANMVCEQCDMRTKNDYPGWYAKDGFRAYDVKGFITEIGAGGVVTTHTDYDKAGYKVNAYEPEEYQQLYAEALFAKAFDPANRKLGVFVWWVMRDLNDRKYKGPIGLNTKGLLTYAGDKKDVYYLYRSFLRPDVPTVHITSQRYFLRRGSVDNGIKVYSNARMLTLTVNGVAGKALQNGNYKQPDGPYMTHAGKSEGLPAPTVPNVFYWPAPLRTGRNTVSVTDGQGHRDTATIYFYGSGGAPEAPSKPIVSALSSSNASNPAYLMEMPVQAQWPIYSDLDSTADDSWDRIPAQIKGAQWIALRRVTKQGHASDLSFTATRPITVHVAASVSKVHAAEIAAGTLVPDFLKATQMQFVPDSQFLWRDNREFLVAATLYSRRVKAG